MHKKRLEVIITAGLIVVFCLSALHAYKVIRKKAAPGGELKDTQASQSTNVSLQRHTGAAQEKTGSADTIVWKRCPFSGKVYYSVEGGESLTLKGIMWDEKVPQALINDTIIKEGDVISRYRVFKIQPNKVILTDGEEDLELTLQ
ncbi:MAG: hypothetical protein KKC84_04640 [Candidatus Omnitrophica bacterium]|nr:hypothetical protein [Candidatus Omnitrophota bacterium]